MADEVPSGPDGHQMAWSLLGVIFLVLVVGTILDRHDFGNKVESLTTDTREERITGEEVTFGSFFPSGDFELGRNVINKREVVVRDRPGGAILGRQPVREVGRFVEGPIDSFNREWLRVDYRNAPDGWVGGDGLTKHIAVYRVLNIFPITFGFLKPILILISIIIIFLIVVIKFKSIDLNKTKKKRKQLQAEQSFSDAKHTDTDDNLPEGLPTGEDIPKSEDVHNRRWANVQALINSHSVNDWKQAIIEADVILEEMLEKMGYNGDGVGDMLKKIEKSDFITLGKAWDAHKVRNRIAHADQGFVLSRDIAEGAIKNYEAVFKEFYYI